MKKNIKFKIGDTIKQLEALEETEEGTIYICRETGEMYLGKLEHRKDKIVNTSCVTHDDEIFDTYFGGFPKALAVLGSMMLSFTEIGFRESGGNTV